MVFRETACFLLFMFRVILSFLFRAALWSPAGKALLYVFVTFPYGVLDQVWYSRNCLLFVIYVSCHTVLSVPCGLVVTCWEGSLVCDGFLCFCHFSIWCPGSGVVFEKLLAFCYHLCFVSYCLVCTLQPCGHLKGKD